MESKRPKDYLRAKEVAELLDIKEQTLALWRHRKLNDLPYIKIRGSIRYERTVVMAYLARNTIGAVDD